MNEEVLVELLLKQEMIEKSDEVAEYVHQAAQRLKLEIPPEYLPNVVDNFTQIAAIASLVTNFELSPDTEIAPVFAPSPKES